MKPRGKPHGAPACYICRSALRRGEEPIHCNLCLVVFRRMAEVHGHDRLECLGEAYKEYRAQREAEQTERIAREMALLR